MKKKMLIQKLMGLVMLALSVVLVMAVKGAPAPDNDVSFLLITVPLGMVLVFGRQCYLSI